MHTSSGNGYSPPSRKPKLTLIDIFGPEKQELCFVSQEDTIYHSPCTGNVIHGKVNISDGLLSCSICDWKSPLTNNLITRLKRGPPEELVMHMKLQNSLS